MSRTFCCNETTVAHAKDGALQGYFTDGVYVFEGVEYAYADRFQQPRAAGHWDGVKDATGYGYICPIMSNPAPSGEAMVPHCFWPASEHCQNLNIWTTSLNAQDRKPVMVWLHGGGYSNGSALEQKAYEGDELAKYGDVVVVTVNHRLNILGYLDLSAFGRKYANSVNAGMADIVEALRWIRRNIAAFGGDPDNVTVFGQSGGGGKVNTLLQIPQADGLFQKGIIMSGLFEGSSPSPETIHEQHTRLVKLMLKALGLGEKQVSELEKVPYDVLVRAFNQAQLRLLDEDILINWAPVQNDYYLGDPMVCGFTEHAKTIPTMVGSVYAEFSPNVETAAALQTEKEKKAFIEKTVGKDNAASLISLFRKAYPEKDLRYLPLADTSCRPACLKYVQKKASVSSAPVYLYLFDQNFTVGCVRPSWHCADIAFVFHNIDRVPCCYTADDALKLQEDVAGSYVSFARTGNPSHAGMPAWKAYTQDTPETMVFGPHSGCRSDFDREFINKLQQSLPPVDFTAMFKEMFRQQAKTGIGGKWMY